MEKGQFAILRFAKYKGPEIGRIEAHNERTKEEYASNPDIDTSRSHLNFHLVKPERSTGQSPNGKLPQPDAALAPTVFVW